jgi:hypothetical protein
MPIRNSTTSYVGRKKDISVLQNPDGLIADPQEIALKFGERARFCAGIQKLIQRYAILLLTNIGSQKYYPDFGTDLIYKLQAGISTVDLIGATQLFNLANFEAVNTLLNYQIEDTFSPPDERISSATLSDINIISSSIYFSVTITTEALSSISFVVPLPI